MQEVRSSNLLCSTKTASEIILVRFFVLFDPMFDRKWGVFEVPSFLNSGVFIQTKKGEVRWSGLP